MFMCFSPGLQAHKYCLHWGLKYCAFWSQGVGALHYLGNSLSPWLRACTRPSWGSSLWSHRHRRLGQKLGTPLSAKTTQGVGSGRYPRKTVVPLLLLNCLDMEVEVVF